MSLEFRYQSASTEYQKIQTELASLVENRTRLDAQLSENEMVKKEFAQLTPSNTVYKLVGPNEAKSNVETRLEFIKSEIKRVDGQINDGEDRSEKKKNEVLSLARYSQ
ncbi:prefoldin subunit 6 [Suillus subluteus]|nr:prefoldin subunit 6 [Suillus subluteus]